MSQAVLIIKDAPTCCSLCPCDYDEAWCTGADNRSLLDVDCPFERPDWCPLIITDKDVKQIFQ